jgi:hypothetical protein
LLARWLRESARLPSPLCRYIAGPDCPKLTGLSLGHGRRWFPREQL